MGLRQRYVLEWCRQQAAAGVVSTDEGVEQARRGGQCALACWLPCLHAPRCLLPQAPACLPASTPRPPAPAQFWLTPAQADVLVHETGPQVRSRQEGRLCRAQTAAGPNARACCCTLPKLARLACPRTCPNRLPVPQASPDFSIGGFQSIPGEGRREGCTATALQQCPALPLRRHASSTPAVLSVHRPPALAPRPAGLVATADTRLPALMREDGGISYGSVSWDITVGTRRELVSAVSDGASAAVGYIRGCRQFKARLTCGSRHPALPPPCSAGALAAPPPGALAAPPARHRCRTGARVHGDRRGLRLRRGTHGGGHRLPQRLLQT